MQLTPGDAGMLAIALLFIGLATLSLFTFVQEVRTTDPSPASVPRKIVTATICVGCLLRGIAFLVGGFNSANDQTAVWKAFALLPEACFLVLYFVICAFLVRVMASKQPSQRELVLVSFVIVGMLATWVIIVACLNDWSIFAVGVEVLLAILYLSAVGALAWGTREALQLLWGLEHPEDAPAPEAAALTAASEIRRRVLFFSGVLLLLMLTRAGWAIALAAGATRDEDGAPLLGSKPKWSEALFFGITEFLPALLLIVLLHLTTQRTHISVPLASSAHGSYGSFHSLVAAGHTLDNLAFRSDSSSTGSYDPHLYGDVYSPRRPKRKKKHKKRKPNHPPPSSPTEPIPIPTPSRRRSPSQSSPESMPGESPLGISLPNINRESE